MKQKHIWVVEQKHGENWCPIVGRRYGVPGVHYTRLEARDAVREIKGTELRNGWVREYRVKQYKSVN